jgi:hypothetical protein
MPIYCRAYRLQQLTPFPGWAPGSGSLEDANAEQLLFLWEDLTVTRSCFDQSDVVFNQVTPEWREFCKSVLQFEVPEDLRRARPGREEVQVDGE